jgi:hypothetical protein
MRAPRGQVPPDGKRLTQRLQDHGWSQDDVTQALWWAITYRGCALRYRVEYILRLFADDRSQPQLINFDNANHHFFVNPTRISNSQDIGNSILDLFCLHSLFRRQHRQSNNPVMAGLYKSIQCIESAEKYRVETVSCSTGLIPEVLLICLQYVPDLCCHLSSEEFDKLVRTDYAVLNRLRNEALEGIMPAPVRDRTRFVSFTIASLSSR